MSTVQSKTLQWPCCTASAEWSIILVSASSYVHSERNTTSARGGTEIIFWPTVVSNCFPHINSPSPDTDQESERVPSYSCRFSETAASYVVLDLWHEIFFWFLAHGLSVMYSAYTTSSHLAWESCAKIYGTNDSLAYSAKLLAVGPGLTILTTIAPSKMIASISFGGSTCEVVRDFKQSVRSDFFWVTQILPFWESDGSLWTRNVLVLKEFVQVALSHLARMSLST